MVRVTAPRVGFFFWPYTPEYTARMVTLGEMLGYDLVGIADTPGNAMDVWVALTLAARCSETVSLAACVTNLVIRHPAITAAAAMSIDAIAPGRMTLGVGTGHSAVVNVGRTPAAPARFRDGLAFVKTLLAGEAATLDGVTVRPPRAPRRVPLYGAASGPRALSAVGAVADGAFVNYGLETLQVARARALLADGAASAGRSLDDVDVWWVACLDCDERRERAHDTLGNILGFVAAYVIGSSPETRGVPADLVPAVLALREAYTTRRDRMDAGLVRRLGLFDYLRARLAVAGTPEDCLGQCRAAIEAGARSLMFTVSLASDPARTVELFGRSVLPAIRGGRW